MGLEVIEAEPIPQFGAWKPVAQVSPEAALAMLADAIMPVEIVDHEPVQSEIDELLALVSH